MESETDNLCRICSKNSEVMSVIENVSICGVKLTEILQVELDKVDWHSSEEFTRKICIDCVLKLKRIQFLKQDLLENPDSSETSSEKEDNYHEDDDENSLHVVNPIEQSTMLDNIDDELYMTIDFEEDDQDIVNPIEQSTTQESIADEINLTIDDDEDAQEIANECVQSVEQQINQEKSAINVFKVELYSEFVIEKPYVNGKKVEPFECKKCGKLFKSRNYIKKHIEGVHLKIKNLRCSLCPAKFHQSGTLNVHMKSHLGTKDHGCKICQKGFVTAAHLRRHINTVHLKIKPFECDNCSYRCGLKADIRRHIMTKHLPRQRQHVCDIDDCQKSYSLVKHLDQHKQAAHGFLKYNCKICNEKFCYHLELRKHYENVHYTN